MNIKEQIEEILKPYREMKDRKDRYIECMLSFLNGTDDFKFMSGELWDEWDEYLSLDDKEYRMYHFADMSINYELFCNCGRMLTKKQIQDIINEWESEKEYILNREEW